MPWGAIAGVAGSVFSSSSAKRAAAANRKWQEQMDNTKRQRDVEDLRAAGLNPILAAHGSGGGGYGAGSAFTGTDIDLSSIQQEISSAKMMRMKQRELDIAQQNADSQSKAVSGTVAFQQGQLENLSERLKLEQAHSAKQIEHLTTTIEKLKGDIEDGKLTLAATLKEVAARTGVSYAQIAKLLAETEVERGRIPGAKKEGEVQSGPAGTVGAYGRILSPWFNPVGAIAGAYLGYKFGRHVPR